MIIDDNYEHQNFNTDSPIKTEIKNPTSNSKTEDNFIIKQKDLQSVLDKLDFSIKNNVTIDDINFGIHKLTRIEKEKRAKTMKENEESTFKFLTEFCDIRNQLELIEIDNDKNQDDNEDDVNEEVQQLYEGLEEKEKENINFKEIFEMEIEKEKSDDGMIIKKNLVKNEKIYLYAYEQQNEQSDQNEQNEQNKDTMDVENLNVNLSNLNDVNMDINEGKFKKVKKNTKKRQPISTADL